MYEHIEKESLGDEGVLLAELKKILEEEMNYTAGLRSVYEFLQTEDPEHAEGILDRMHTQDVLACSLVERIPSGTDLLGRQNMGFNGVSFQQLERGKRGSRVHRTRRYREKLTNAIKFYLLPREKNISYILGHTSSSYTHALVNLQHYVLMSPLTDGLLASLPDWQDIKKRYAGMQRTDFVEFIASSLEVSDEATLKSALDFESEKPLVDLATGTELNSAAKFNVRMALEKLLDGEGELADVEEVLFTDAGLYYYKQSEICYLPLTEQLVSFLGKAFGETMDQRYKEQTKLSAEKWNEDIQNSRARVSKVFAQVIDQKTDLERRSGLEKTIAITSTQGFKLYLSNLREVGLLRDSEYQKELLRLLNLVKCLAPTMPELCFDLSKKRVTPKLERREDVAVHMQKEFQKLLDPKWWERRIDPHSNPLNVTRFHEADLHIVHEHGDIYNSVFIQKMLGHMFINFITSQEKDDKDIYDIFKGYIGPKRIYQDTIKLNTYGFRPGSKRAEYAVLTQYFMRFGALYVDEANSGIVNDRLPSELRDFFRRHISKEAAALSDGEGNALIAE